MRDVFIVVLHHRSDQETPLGGADNSMQLRRCREFPLPACKPPVSGYHTELWLW